MKLPYIEVVATELLCNASGKSESKIQDIFEEAEKCAPCILFIDELDVICPQKESADKDVKSRIVSQLSSCLHGDYILIIIYLKDKIIAFHKRYHLLYICYNVYNRFIIIDCKDNG